MKPNDGLKLEEMSEEQQLLLRSIRGGIWQTKPVEDEPVIALSRWHVFAVPSPKGEGVDHHFNGYRSEVGEGRVSSKIMEFDQEKMIGTTRSGRKYQLIGQPGSTMDAVYVYHNWLRMNSVVEEDVEDATGDYLTLEQKQDIKPGYTE